MEDYDKIMTIDNFYQNIYKKNMERITALAIVNKLAETDDIKYPMTFSMNGSRAKITINVFNSKPEFIFDIDKKDFGFNLGTVDYEFLIFADLDDIFKKYLHTDQIFVSENPCGKIYFDNFNKIDPLLKYKFIIEYIDKLYEYEVGDKK